MNKRTQLQKQLEAVKQRLDRKNKQIQSGCELANYSTEQLNAYRANEKRSSLFDKVESQKLSLKDMQVNTKTSHPSSTKFV